MGKGLQQRAETLVERFSHEARKPVVVEFSGTPKAGKSTTVSHVAGFLRRCGFRVEVVVERASLCPIRDKKHFNFNVWTAASSLAAILDKTQEPPRPDDPQILILDRGLFDAISWLRCMDRWSRIRSADRQCIESFLLMDNWRQRIGGVVMMTASPEVALQREAGPVPVTGKEGGIMNPPVLDQMRRVVKETAGDLHDQFRIFDVDTSAAAYGSPERTVAAVLDFILTLIEEQLAEEILGVPKDEVLPLFSTGTTLIGEQAQAVLTAFSQGSFGVRAAVEASPDLIQALPVAIVRNKTGQVLLLRRREKPGSKNRLHEQLVIWAGGHVRREDSASGRPLETALMRELQEELRLCIEESELRFLGAVYAQSGGNTGKHVALVYEWRADTDDIAVALSSAEFFERRGTSLSGRFVAMDQVIRDIQEGKVTEPWSTEIARSLLTNGESVQARLL